MGISMVRKPSETPNVTNIDDIIPFRYAYGNQNGYVIDKGNELSYTINGNEFRINSGRIVLDGVESDIDANGVAITVDPIAGTRYYTVYYQVNLATNTTLIDSENDSAGYPTIPKGDDLTENSAGIANLELYHFEANNGVISNVEKVVKDIVYSGTALRDYDISKGTIEERLTALGFREGSVTLASGITASTNYISRQGNYVIGKIFFSSPISLFDFSGSRTIEIGNIPPEFRPKSNGVRTIFSQVSSYVEARIISVSGSGSSSINVSFNDTVGITNDGDIIASSYYSGTSSGKLGMSWQLRLSAVFFAYEADPIE